MVKVADQAAELAHVNGLQVSSSIATSLVSNEKMTNLPTPVVADAYTGDLKSGQQKEGSMHSIALPHAIAMLSGSLLPTPMSRDWKGDTAPHERDGVVQTDSVERAIFHSGEINETQWGKFEPAIRRWEQTLGRAAPSPTKADGKDGNHRLSSKFTEWMMGLPEGWVTDVGLKRNDELKACGNGVVPQQAELALRGLLKGLI
jgi:DNA (cytosine-5)-methyltransferase 1|tara:strand:+ start:800 stop:1405 length:606 start_codon:yes stop_codon:yes gene_type:complete